MSEKICEICKNLIEENEEITSCPDCGREFHSKCWRMTGCCVGPECRAKATERKETEQKKKQEEIAAEKAKVEAAIRKCPKCGKKLETEEIFCGKCGTKFGEEVKEESRERICLNCGRKMNDKENFCWTCGTKFGEKIPEKTLPKKASSKSKWVLITAALIILSSVAFLAYEYGTDIFKDIDIIGANQTVAESQASESKENAVQNKEATKKGTSKSTKKATTKASVKATSKSSVKKTTKATARAITKTKTRASKKSETKTASRAASIATTKTTTKATTKITTRTTTTTTVPASKSVTKTVRLSNGHKYTFIFNEMPIVLGNYDSYVLINSVDVKGNYEAEYDQWENGTRFLLWEYDKIDFTFTGTMLSGREVYLEMEFYDANDNLFTTGEYISFRGKEGGPVKGIFGINYESSNQQLKPGTYYVDFYSN